MHKKKLIAATAAAVIALSLAASGKLQRVVSRADT